MKKFIILTKLHVIIGYTELRQIILTFALLCDYICRSKRNYTLSIHYNCRHYEAAVQKASQFEKKIWRWCMGSYNWFFRRFNLKYYRNWKINSKRVGKIGSKYSPDGKNIIKIKICPVGTKSTISFNKNWLHSCRLNKIGSKIKLGQYFTWIRQIRSLNYCK